MPPSYAAALSGEGYPPRSAAGDQAGNLPRGQAATRSAQLLWLHRGQNPNPILYDLYCMML